jgi:endonuclease-3
MNQKNFAALVHNLLIDFYGEPTWRPHLSPVAELVSTILSQNTNDQNRDLAFDRLREKFPTWEAVRDAPEEEVIEAIRPAGLANQKGPRLQQALKIISDTQGELTLDFLQNKSVNQARKWLESIHGVGPKTAAIVLLFAFNKPAFPVDTHVHRVTGRLGLLPEKMSAEKAHDYLAEQFEPETFYPVHLNFIRLGREICQARSPQCPDCPLQEVCSYYENEYQPDLD